MARRTVALVAAFLLAARRTFVKVSLLTIAVNPVRLAASSSRSGLLF